MQVSRKTTVKDTISDTLQVHVSLNFLTAPWHPCHRGISDSFHVIQRVANIKFTDKSATKIQGIGQFHFLNVK